MDHFYNNILDQIGVFSSFITSAILFFKTKGAQRHANRLLALVIFAFGWYAAFYLMSVWGIIKDYPNLFRVGSPLYYLVPPCAYIYVRSILFDETRFRKWDWLNFLPAVLHLIELIPFYMEDTATKRKIVEEISNNIVSGAFMGSGLIPAKWHFELRAWQGIIYLVFQWRLLIPFLQSPSSKTLRQFSGMIGWLVSFSCLVSVLYLGVAWQAIFLLIRDRTQLAAQVVNDPSITFMSLSFVGLTCYLLFKPDILYGIIRVRPAALTPSMLPLFAAPAMEFSSMEYPAAEALPTEALAMQFPSMDTRPTAVLAPHPTAPSPPVDGELLEAYALQITGAIGERQLFKKKGLTLASLAQELSVPTHHLSYILRHFHRQQFNDFINGYRVNYIKTIMQQEDWIQMTLEAHAAEAGFSSRSTFFTAFKKQTGLTPAEYAKQLR